MFKIQIQFNPVYFSIIPFYYIVISLTIKWTKNFITITVFKISAGPRTLTGKIWVGLASFPSLSYINIGKIVLRSGKFQILFWRLNNTNTIETYNFRKKVNWVIGSVKERACNIPNPGSVAPFIMEWPIAIVKTSVHTYHNSNCADCDGIKCIIHITRPICSM